MAITDWTDRQLCAAVLSDGRAGTGARELATRIWNRLHHNPHAEDPELAIGDDLTRIGAILKIARVLGKGSDFERLLTDEELRGLILDRLSRLEWCA